jgi:hypothetical protein
MAQRLLLSADRDPVEDGPVLLRALRKVAFGLACALAAPAFAGEPEPLKQVAEDLAQIFADVRITPLDDGKLEELRGGIASRPLMHTGVVLWDEPRKGLPPQRGINGETAPAGLGGPGVGITINR